MRFARLALVILLAANASVASAKSMETDSVPLEQVIRNAEAIAKKKGTSRDWATVGRLYAMAYEGLSDASVPMGVKDAANALETDPSLRIAPIASGVESHRTRAIEAYRKSVEKEASNAASWLALGWLYRCGPKPDAKLAIQAYTKVDRLLPAPQRDAERLLLSEALDALESLKEGDPAALARIAKRRAELAPKPRR